MKINKLSKSDKIEEWVNIYEFFITMSYRLKYKTAFFNWPVVSQTEGEISVILSPCLW